MEGLKSEKGILRSEILRVKADGRSEGPGWNI